MTSIDRSRNTKTCLITVIIASLLIISFVPYTCSAYSGGDGTAGNPYKIANVADFQLLSATSADWGKSFILTANINLTGLTFTYAPITTFSGTFDGNNHAISNLTIYASTQNNVGLFGYVDGEIHNLGVENVNITGRDCVGGLVGRNYDGSVTSCYSTGSVSGNSSVGGLVGDNDYGLLTSCYATGSASGTGGVGGLVGENYWGTLTYCYATGTVTGTGGSVGGLVGSNGGTLTNCYAIGSVTGGSGFGGLVGSNGVESSITACFWDVQTSSQTTSDGGIGKTTAEMKTLLTFTSAGWNFVNIWMLPANDYPRLAWETNGSVVAMPRFSPDGGAYSSEQNVTITCLTVGATIHYTTNGLDPTESDLVIASGDSVAVSINPATTLKAGAFKVGLSYSGVKTAIYFKSTYSGGMGTTANPYKIANVVDFQQLCAKPTDWGKSFILTADINLTGLTFTQAPIAPDTSTSLDTQFTGTFDGKGHIISNLTITASTKDYIGLFGDVGSGGKISNLGIEDVNMTGGHSVGGLVGNNWGTLTSCYATGSVSGTVFDVGGLVGFNWGTLTSCYATCSVNGTVAGGLVGSNFGTLISCCATGSVSGNSSVGGLVGGSSGTLTDCYATGSVNGGSYVGGLVGDYDGQSWGSLTSCYSTGSVTGTGDYVGGLVGENYYYTTIYDCFWDIQTSGKTTSACGTGKTTAEMKTLSTFTWEGWDFSATDGDPADWIMPSNDYPRLAWQFSPTQQTGNLQVTIGPVDAISAGAQWNVDGGLWQNSGDTVTGLSTDSHTVNYKSVTGWGAPINEQVTINDGQTNSISRSYTQAIQLPPPDNDMFADATEIFGTSGQDIGSNIAATKESGEPNHAGIDGGASVWWKWTAPSSGVTQITTFGSDFDTLLAVYTGNSVDGLTEIFSDDDANNVAQSSVAFNATAGTTYKIAVDGCGQMGNIILNWGDPSPVSMFGSINGKTVKLTLQDIYGVNVTFSLTGGGYGEIIGGANFDQIILSGTSDKSQLTISTKGKNEISVGSIIVNGSLKGISAKTTNLRGAITVTGSLGTLTLNDVADDHTITIGSPTIPNPKAAVTIAFDRVADLTINSDIPIKSISVTEWLGGSIDAPLVSSITTRGDKKRGIAGDLNIGITTSGNIGAVKVAGALSSEWNCNTVKSITTLDLDTFNLKLNQSPDTAGKILSLGTLTVKGYFYGSNIQSAGNIGMVTAGIMIDSSCFAGVAEGITGLPVAEAASFSQTATIKSFAIKGVKGESTPFFSNSNIAATNILSASIVYPQSGNGGVPFGLSANYIKKLTIKKNDGKPASLKELKESKDSQTIDGVEIRLY